MGSRESTDGDKPLWVTSAKGAGQVVSTRGNDGVAGKNSHQRNISTYGTAQGIRHQVEQELVMVPLPSSSPFSRGSNHESQGASVACVRMWCNLL